MYRNRVIPCLTYIDRDLVKTKQFKNAKYIGDPINAIKIFNEKEVDELIVLDIRASQQKRPPNFELIKDITSECFMPVCYGGGISTLDEIKKIIRLGVEKVSINSSLNENINIIKEASQLFGSQAIVASIDVKKTFFGKYKIKNGKKDIIEWAKELEAAGAGEILLTSVDHDGVKNGYNLELIKKVSNAINIPLIACGGAGTTEHLKEAIMNGASALAVGSMFVLKGKHDAVLISYLPSNERLQEEQH